MTPPPPAHPRAGDALCDDQHRQKHGARRLALARGGHLRVRLDHGGPLARKPGAHGAAGDALPAAGAPRAPARATPPPGALLWRAAAAGRARALRALAGRRRPPPPPPPLPAPQAMKDQHPYVRDTTAWTIGRAFEFLHDTSNPEVPPLVTGEFLPPIVQARRGGGGGVAAPVRWQAAGRAVAAGGLRVRAFLEPTPPPPRRRPPPPAGAEGRPEGRDPHREARVRRGQHARRGVRVDRMCARRARRVLAPPPPPSSPAARAPGRAARNGRAAAPPFPRMHTTTNTHPPSPRMHTTPPHTHTLNPPPRPPSDHEPAVAVLQGDRDRAAGHGAAQRPRLLPRQQQPAHPRVRGHQRAGASPLRALHCRAAPCALAASVARLPALPRKARPRAAAAAAAARAASRPPTRPPSPSPAPAGARRGRGHAGHGGAPHPGVPHRHSQGARPSLNGMAAFSACPQNAHRNGAGGGAAAARVCAQRAAAVRAC